ncbi:plasmid pRiA4b ORF-3 family protein [Dactylosporangium sp. NPDC005555]|uniref:plasmid pRiA4b ORF-3 family protein n=1 Tax=Dactylosporangium sp. NPDC005555 TaxID=3154889 RepID=UPI0033A94F20
MTAVLLEAAGDCPIMRRAAMLAGWVGGGRPVTAKGVLKPVDIPAAMAAMGLQPPGRARTAADVESLHRPWVAAQAIELIRVDAGVAQAGGTPADALESWWAALSAVLRVESHDREGEGASVLCRTLLAVLAKEPTVGEIENRVHRSLLAEAEGWYVGAAHQAFRRGMTPVDAGVELLAEFGAVDAGLRLTPLGRWADQRFAALVPEPVTADLAAADLLTRIAGRDERGVRDAARQWLAGRDVKKAVAEVLAVAESATPAERVAGVDLVGALGVAMRSAWRSALRRPMLAPHARAALATWEDADRAPSEADHRWLAVEYALAVEDLEEAWRLVDDFGGLDVVAESSHPDAGALLDALNAAGPPPCLVYQLKIALSRISPPAWRRLRVPATIHLDVLHDAIQVAFGWGDDHLHFFEVDRRRYADPDFELDDCGDESDVRLIKALPAGGTMTYVFDMGDWWEHRITLERIDPVAEIAFECVGGRGPGATPFDIDGINRRLATYLA